MPKPKVKTVEKKKEMAPIELDNWVNEFMHSYGVHDDDRFGAGDVEELCQAMIYDFYTNKCQK